MTDPKLEQESTPFLDTLRIAGLSYTTRNLGDEIQSIAAERLTGEIHERFDRDQLRTVQRDAKYLLIMNGWYAERPETCFPPAECILPVITGFHIAKKARRHFLSPESIDYFRHHVPVGCRDLQTQAWLKAAGVETYYSKCLTLTLPTRAQAPEEGKVVLVDLPAEVLDYLPPQLKAGAVFRTHRVEMDTSDKFEKAQALLDYYRDHARLVVTGRLHCVLPCVAMGIPVVFFGKPHDYRISVAKSCGLRIHRPRLFTWMMHRGGGPLRGPLRRLLIDTDRLLSKVWYRWLHPSMWKPQMLDVQKLKSEIERTTRQHMARIVHRFNEEEGMGNLKP